MEKLNSIEGNTINLSKDVSNNTSRLDDHSKRIKANESSKQTQDIKDLKMTQSSLVEEVNQKVAEQMQIIQQTMHKDNELFRAELINMTNRKIGQFSGPLKEEIQEIGREVKEVKDEVAGPIKEEIREIKGEIRGVKGEIKEVKEDTMEEKGFTRKNNLIIVGLQEAGEGGSDRSLIQDLFSKTMGVPKTDIDSLFRLGKSGGSGPRPILVRFQRFSDRNKVWFSKSKLKNDSNSKIWIQEDAPKPIKDAQKKLYHTFKRAKAMGDTFTSVQLKGTKLLIDGVAYGEGDLETLPPALQPASLATISSSTVVAFFGHASPLSNHHHSPFQLEGHRFSCMEQFLAWKKAKISGKKALATRALASENPAVCKGILNELKENKSAK